MPGKNRAYGDIFDLRRNCPLVIKDYDPMRGTRVQGGADWISVPMASETISKNELIFGTGRP